MDDPHSDCPTLGHARILPSIADRWAQRVSLDAQTGEVLAELDELLLVASQRWTWQVIEDETGMPRSTANGRLLRYLRRTTDGEVAA